MTVDMRSAADRSCSFVAVWRGACRSCILADSGCGQCSSGMFLLNLPFALGDYFSFAFTIGGFGFFKDIQELLAL